MPSLCIGYSSSDADATHDWFRAFAGVPCRHVVLRDPGKFIGCMRPVPSPMTLAFDLSGGSRHFQSPTLRFLWEGSYRDLLTVRSRYDLSTCSPPLSEPTKAIPRPTEAFTSGLSTAWSPAPSPDITTGATGQAPLTGLSPVRTPTSIAATAHRTGLADFPHPAPRKRHTPNPTRYVTPSATSEHQSGATRLVVNPPVLRHFLRSSLTEVPSLHRHYIGFVSTTGLSATPHGPACLSRGAS